MENIDHSLVHSYQEIMGDMDAEDAWLDEHREEVILVYMDDPSFCSCYLVFIPTKHMGFSCYRTSNCVSGAYIGFFYPQHVMSLASGSEELVKKMASWEFERAGIE